MKPQKSDMRIKKVSTAELVCDKIKENIKEGIWKVGERIPSENDLAEAFGVNRLTVRMALQKLNALGVLETRVGSGTYVVQFNFDGFINEIAEFYMQPELLEDVFEFRKLLELECAKLAIERGTQEEMDELKRLADHYSVVQKQTYNLYSNEALQQQAKADLDFHFQICKMSHNSLYIYAYTVARESIYQYLLMIIKRRLDTWKQHGVPPEKVAEQKDLHKDVYRAIRDKDYERCHKIYLDMVDHRVEL